ncbi:MAG TPA: response regulator [Desulfonauticus sp.]|nr:MAG: Response regulator receiver protein [Desulfonauticus sp. 38_4375]MDK2921865.1 hypothetical protein [Desulfonauticus sp.]HCO11954.1 response regulator [Desulfonauticus sp.]
MKAKILLVDDEKAFVEILTKRLTKRGFSVSRAYSGEEAIRLLRKEDFDLVILDLKMEDMDGLEVLNIIKKMVPNLSVVMLSGHGSEDAARKGLDLGACDYLLKPCELEELLECIEKNIPKKGGKDA